MIYFKYTQIIRLNIVVYYGDSSTEAYKYMTTGIIVFLRL